MSQISFAKDPGVAPNTVEKWALTRSQTRQKDCFIY